MTDERNFVLHATQIPFVSDTLTVADAENIRVTLLFMLQNAYATAESCERIKKLAESLKKDVANSVRLCAVAHGYAEKTTDVLRVAIFDDKGPASVDEKSN